MNRGVHDSFLGRVAGADFFDDLSALRHQNPIGHRHDFRQVGGNDDDGEPFVGQRVDELMDLDDRADVDPAGGLIENDELRLLD